MTKVQKKLPSHNIGFAKAGAKFPGVEDFRTLSRKKTFSFFIFCKFEKRKWFLLEFVFIESFKFLSPAFAKPLTVVCNSKKIPHKMLNNRIIYKYKRKLDNKFYYEKREEILKDYRMKIKNSANSLQKIYYFFEKNIRLLNLTTLQNLYYIK